MGKKLAIRGHSTRGKEVIKLLEMMGGNNIHQYDGEANAYSYYISSNVILNDRLSILEDDDFEIFTLQSFLEKYPFKVGDMVTLDNKLCSIIWMCWECNKIYYQVQGPDPLFVKKVTANELKPYKEKNTNMNTEFDLSKYSYEVKDGKLVITEKKPKYPTTYKECWKVRFEVDGETTLEEFHNVSGYYSGPLGALQKLLCCRDAYWKIAGEEMGLDEPWKPDYNDLNIAMYGLYDELKYSIINPLQFVFPTEEMRNAFYDNFKDLIEQCK